jgi:TolA-binding protein
MRINQFGLCFVALFTFGCAQSPTVAVQDGRLNKLYKQKQMQEQRIEQGRFQKFVLGHKKEFKKKSMAQYKLPKLVTEENLYSEVLRTYQSREIDGVEFYTETLVKKYPQSIFADNALYLKGQLYLVLGSPSEALREFERIVTNYPISNKRAGAILGKGVAYRKLQLFGYAKKAYSDVKRNYPGSPEFYKVALEEKLLELEKGS